MGPARQVSRSLGLAALCCSLGAALAAASEVTQILSELEGSFKGAHDRLAACQSRLDRLQLNSQLDRPDDASQELSGQLGRIAAGAAQAIESLRAKYSKIGELETSLQERFPEDSEQIRRHYSSFQTTLARSERLHDSVRQELEQARVLIASQTRRHRAPRGRDDLLAAVVARHRQRERRLGTEGSNDLVGSENGARETSSLDPSAPQDREPLSALRLNARALGHPPVTQKPGGPGTPAGEVTGAAFLELSPSASAPSITVDLEQLIQEMER